MDNKKSAKIRKNFYCKSCDYTTSDKKDYNKHVLTRKHKKSAKADKKTPNVEFVCQCCGKSYKYKSGLSRHKKKCSLVNLGNVENDNSYHFVTHINKKEQKTEPDETLIKLLMKQQEQTNETIKLLKEAVDANTKMSKNVGNNNNNTISINLFLQEKCQNAMNLTDFIDQLHVSLDDLDYSKDNGFVMGMANILTKKLKDLKPTERPIHCSDKKRLQFYVKDDNKWGKDKNNEKIDKTIKTIKRKQTIKLTEWEKMHPNFRNNPIELKEWQQLLCGMTEDPSEQQPEKIKIALKRSLANYTQLKDAMEIN
jgi:hypothetical protein